MRILVFSTDDFLPPAGGAETAIWEIARRMPQHSFTLICGRLERNRSKQEIVGNVLIRRVGVGYKIVDGLLLALCGGVIALRMHRHERFDIVWAVLASYGAFAATLFRWCSGVPYLLTLQEGNDVTRGIRNAIGFKQLYSRLFLAADGLQAISQYLLDWGFRMGFQKSKPAELIPNGIDRNLFSEHVSDDSIISERARYGFFNDVFIISTVSRLVPKNGIGDIIRALVYLPKKFVLVIHGFGPLLAKLKHTAHACGVEERVRFIGQISRDKLPIAIRASDVFVRPSLTEGLGTAFLEAMAAGVPVIATPVGGIVDFLRDGENGFFTPPQDPKELARTIERVSALDISQRAVISERARSMVFNQYDWDMIANRMDRLFNRIAT